MTQKQVARRHHYIPQFYLKRWTSAGKLVEYSKPYGNKVGVNRRVTKQVGWVDRLYTLKGVPEEYAAIFEHQFLSPVDNAAADVLTKMERNVLGFNAAERVAWAQFVLSLVLRHPENVASIQERYSESLLVVDRDAEKRWSKVRRPSDPNTFAEAMKEEMERNPDDISRRGLKLMFEMMENEKIGSHLFGMKWGSIYLPTHIPALLTSDRPVHWFGALQDENCHIMMPVGPKRIFWAANNIRMASFIRSINPLRLQEFMNANTVRRAAKFVYGLSDRHIDYVQSFMGVDPEVTVADIVTQKSTASEIRRRKRLAARKGALVHGGSNTFPKNQ